MSKRQRKTFTSEMDEMLIEYVRGNEALYDLSNKKYSDNQYKSNVWTSIGEKLELVFFALLETLSAQEGYNYPAPTRPLSGGPERPAGQGRPGRPDTQPGQGITSFPNTGYSTGISRPVQQLPGSQGSNGYPERGRPSGQEFPSIPQGNKNGFSRVPGNKQREQGFSDQRETTQGYPSQNYPSSSASDQRYPGTSDKFQSRPSTTQNYPSRPGGSQTYPNQESYSGSQNYPEQQTGSTEEGYPKQQGAIQGYPDKQRGSSRGYPGEQKTGQGYSGQQEDSGAQGNSQVLPSKQASSQRYPSQQNNQNYPSDLSADRGYSEQPATPASYNEQQRGPQRPQGQENRGQIGTPDYRGQQQGTGNIPEQGQFPESGVFPEQQQLSAFDEGDYSAIPGEPDRDYPILSEIPQTSFSCDQQQYPGYYTDVETRCQVFHICANNKTYDFLCPNGTIFHQEYFVCVWWNQFNCDSAPSLYELNANIYDYSINGGQGLPSVIGETGGVGYPEESQTFGPQQPGGYPNRQEQGYSPNELPSGYPSERPADTKPVQPSGPRRPSSSFQQEYPSGSQESSTGYSAGRVPEKQIVGGGYQNGIQEQPGRSPNESVENQRPQFPKNRPTFTPRPFNQNPSVGANGYPSLEPGFPSTTPTETSSQEGGNGYSNGRPGTSFPGSRPQGPTQGYLPPFP